MPIPVSRRTFIGTTGIGIASLWSALGSASQNTRPNDLGELTGLSLGTASDLVRRRKVSPVELTNACLARIEQLNPTLNAFITVTNDLARTQARTAEDEIQRGRWRGPLHGIPIALKDLFDTAQIRTTAASGVFKDRIPTEDAEVVRRLKAAGAVLIGKTNMVECAYGSNAAVSFFGPVHNPWDLDRNPGGSSSGSAVAVAAGLCYGALGSDTAGSIRQPAALCGIVGMKPTYGLVSTRGVLPLSWFNDHVGPMTRTVEDNALLLQVLAAYDPADLNSVQIPVPEYRIQLRHSTASIRVGVPRTYFLDDLDPEVEAATKKALTTLEAMTAGSAADVALPGSMNELEAARATVRAAEAYTYHRDWVSRMPTEYQPETLIRLRSGADVTALDYIRARQREVQARRDITDVFRRVDILVMPAVPRLPSLFTDLAIDVSTSMRVTAPYARNTSPFNVYGIPSISVPCGFSKNGLPIGLQICGAHGTEATVFQVAAAFEKAAGLHARPKFGL